jgi:mycothiol synthase
MDVALDYTIVSGPEARDVVARMVAGTQVGRGGPDPVEVFARFLDRYGIDASRQAVARDNGRIVAYCLCLVNPGATATVLLPERFDGLDRRLSFRHVAAGVLKYLVRQAPAWDLAFFQAMVTDEKSLIGQIYLDAGFVPLCRLMIMEAAADPQVRVPDDADVTWIPFGPDTEQRFAHVILSSYEGSRDCPRLTGLRTGTEILAGHRCSGLFEPEGWQLLYHRRQDAGVLLMNRTEESSDRLELIYMGLAPWARGQGLGDKILNRAFQAARQLGKKVIRLAVDCDNVPAVRLYRRFGFRPVGRQTVLAVLNEKRRRRVDSSE